jgi:hypothetical protein
MILKNWNEQKSFSETPKYKTSWKSVQWFSSCYMRTDGTILPTGPKMACRADSTAECTSGDEQLGSLPTDVRYKAISTDKLRKSYKNT